MRFERFPIVLALLLTLSLATAPLFGQSLTTGSVTGTVSDPSHAVIPNAPVSLKGLDTGSTASTTTNASGGYSFSLLKPGRYQVTVKQGGFAEVSQTLQVEVGQNTKADIDLTVAKGTETVEVSGTAPLINTEPSNNTAFTQEEVAQLPSAGGDITNIADTAPGVGGQRNWRLRKLHRQRNAGHVEPVHGQRRERHGPVLQHQQLGCIEPDAGPERNRRSDGHHESLRRPVRTARWRPGHLRHQVGHQQLPRQCHRTGGMAGY